MNPDEYEKLRRVDQEHWFYRGKRAIVRHWIERFIQLRPDDLLIDAGVGTGTWAAEMAQHCRVIGIDDHDESLALAGPLLQAAGGRVIKSSLEAVDLPAGSAAVVTLLDVLEHIVEDIAALREMCRLTRPRGLLVMTVPALPWLWSDWDESLQHRRRYTKASLLRVLDQPGVTVVRCKYINTAALLPMAMVRWSRRFRAKRECSQRFEDEIPPALLNNWLYHLMVTPACCDWWPAPIGASLLAVLKRN